MLGEEHPDTLDGMDRLAWAYDSQGRPEAEEIWEQAMVTTKKAQREEHSATLDAMTALGLYRNRKLLKEAEEFQVQVVETALRVLGDQHPGTMGSMENLAVTYMFRGRLKEAEELQLYIMETNRKDIRRGASGHGDRHGQPRANRLQTRGWRRGKHLCFGRKLQRGHFPIDYYDSLS